MICECVTLHSYAAYVTADSWDVVVHVCRCGREHVRESLLPPKKLKREQSTIR
jgi:hypothetical protein